MYTNMLCTLMDDIYIDVRMLNDWKGILIAVNFYIMCSHIWRNFVNLYFLEFSPRSHYFLDI